MPTPTQRLEDKLLIQQCRVCSWLATLSITDRRDWVQAISNPRYSAPLVAAEIRSEQSDEAKLVSEGSVQNHRQKSHR